MSQFEDEGEEIKIMEILKLISEMQEYVDRVKKERKDEETDFWNRVKRFFGKV